MKYTKLFACALLILLWACKKNNNTTSAENDNLDPSDSKSLFLSIKVNHGQKTDGSLPTASDNGPKLDETIANKTMPSIAGKYVIIHPEVLSGEIAGYYLRITGYHDAYFKIDFSKPISGRRKTTTVKKHGPLMKIMDDNPDYMDSVIVIKLPDNIKPGTFCVEYIAYDWDNNTSNIVKQCITVSSLGGEEKLAGKWSLEKRKDLGEDWKYYPISDTVFRSNYVCGSDNKPFEVYDSLTATSTVPSFLRKYDYYYWQALGDGSGKEEYNEIELNIDFNESTCDNFKFKSEGHTTSTPFIWSFDPQRKKLIIILIYEAFQDFYFLEMDMEFINQDRISLHYIDNIGLDEEWWEMVRMP